MENNKKRPNANKKLKNIDTIKKMLDGTHHSQTKKSISTYVGNSEKRVKREVGERWTDANGEVWEQREGFRIQGVDRAERMAEIRKYLDGASKCPECNEKMNKRLDKKYYNIHKMCMECSVKLETKMRYEGTWESYEKEKVLANVKGWLKDAEIEKDILIEQIGKDSYVNSDGKLEKWELPYDVKEQQKRIEKGFVEFKKNLLTKYGATEEELEQFGVSENGENDG
jgi:hypothetical protein